jgi:segregation and condensation protein A
MDFTVKTQTYEGPLDLLLDLIEKRKLFINEISLATIADDFIGYIQQHQEFPLDKSTEFIVIASALLLIKSRSLLPNLTLTPEEEESIDELEKRLAHYQRIKELSKNVQGLFGKELMFTKSETNQHISVFVPDQETTLVHVAESIKSVLARIVKIEKLPEVAIRKIISIEEMIGKLTKRVQQSISMSFKQFSGHGRAEKTEVIISFLAMLELVKQGVILAKQEGHFQDISMHKEEVGVPSYQ